MPMLRIGIQIEPNDSFWIQVEEAIYRTAEHLNNIELVPLEVSDPLTADLLDEEGGLVEELLAYDINALICKDILPFQLPAILNRKLPIIYLAETDFQHQLFASPRGLYETARLVGTFLAEKLAGKGHILCAGGLVEGNADDGSTRLAGFGEALSGYPNITWDHIPTAWGYYKASEQIREAIRRVGLPIHAIFGLSDTVALAAHDVADELHLIDKHIHIAGINGDPLALAAIAEGKMALTVETPASEFGRKAIELAYQAASGESFSAHFSYEPHLITIDNVNTVALQKLIAIADIPSRMVGVNRRQEQNRLVQLETSAEISRHVGTLLDRHALLAEISNLIRSNYEYNDVHVFFWTEPEQCFTRVLPEDTDPGSSSLSPDRDPVMVEVIRSNAPVFIPDARTSQRFPPNPQFPRTHSRVTLPIQLGDKVVGVLDLHSHQPTVHLRHELIGLQSLANQLGIVMKNSELYAEALDAKASAERADLLKTRLLANVSHELRTPLNVIIGYAQTALSTPNPYHLELPPTLQRDLGYISQSGQHLLHLINDLLSLSQAEIGALELFKEAISTKSFLEEVFNSLASIVDKSNVTWQLALPEQLPMIEADPVRLRQILLNLLHNASKFTSKGLIELGADVMPPYLHLWVQDTGMGIPTDMQEHIFEPFVKIEQREQRQMGVGLGLTIVRRLVALQGGSITLESRTDCGSTFHIYLPLPDASGRDITPSSESAEPVLLLISKVEIPTRAITTLCQQQQLTIYNLHLSDDLNAVLKKVHPAGLAWDLTNAEPNEWKLFERLRAHPQMCQLPLIVYGQEHSTASGMIDVLMKPISDKGLIATLMALYPQEEQGFVLIVDDDADARALYQKLAMQALPNHTIRSVENGAEALILIQKEVPGLVILDLMMPEVDGFAVIEWMRANTKTRNVPIVVMSGRLLTSEDVRRLDYGNVVFHSKNLLTEEETSTAFQQALNDPKSLSQPTSLLVKQALSYLHRDYSRASLSRQEIAAAIGTSKQHLDRIFSKELHLSVIEYLNRLRIQRAKDCLVQTSDEVTSVAMQVGFNDSAYFSRVFRKLVGQSPTEYRKHLSGRIASDL